MRAWPIALLAVWTFAPVVLAEGNVQVTVDRDTVVQGDEFRITVQVAGDRLGEPELPDVPGLEISPQPVYRSIQASIVNGRTSTSKVRGYNAIANQTGTITIPPIPVKIGDSVAVSQPLTITVLPKQHGASNRGNSQLTMDDVLQLTVDVSRHEVYVGQPVKVTYTLWALGGSVVRQYSSDFPETAGFYAVPRDPQQLDDGVSATRNARQYTAVHWVQTLYPTRTGELEIGPWKWQGVVSAPFSVSARNKSFATDPVTINVKALPAPPKGFTGAVGHFDIAARKTNASAIRGVPFDLTVTVSGKGNPDSIQAPTLPEIDWAYVAEPQRQPGNDPRSGDDTVSRTFVYSITPIKDGKQELPGIQFCYFDPELEDYVTAATGELDWDVRPSSESDHQAVVDAGRPNGEGNVEVLGQDILPIVTDAGTLHRHSSLVWVATPIVLLPSLAYGGLLLFVRRRRRFEGDTRYARAHRATRLAQRRFAGIHELPDPVDGVYKALAGYLADVFNVQETGMTSADAEKLLATHGIDTDIANGLVRILKTCERARYGSTALTDDELNALVHGALMNMERLDAVRTKGGVS